MINKGLMTSKTDEWATPQAFFDELNKEFNFELDVCATKENAKCAKYFTKKQDGLAQNWDNLRVWMNPPYGREIGKWVKKASEARGGGSSVLTPGTNRHTLFPSVYLQQGRDKICEGSLKVRRFQELGPLSKYGGSISLCMNPNLRLRYKIK